MTLCVIESAQESTTSLSQAECSKTKQPEMNKLDALPSKQDKESESGLFCCPEPGCVKEYIKLGNLEKHIASEKHIYKEANEPLGDCIMTKWAEQFEKISLQETSPKESEHQKS